MKESRTNGRENVLTPYEKAVQATNRRIELLQGRLRAAKEPADSRILIQSLLVTIAASEALTDYIKTVGKHAERRHQEMKQTHEALSMQHAALLESGKILLEKLKADPADRAIRKEIERVQRDMAAAQKALRRGANAMQDELRPGMATIDQMADNVRRLSDADTSDALKRLLKATVGCAHELYATQQGLPAQAIMDAEQWEKAAVSDLNQAAGFDDAHSRSGYQLVLALELMTLAVSESPPGTSEEAAQRAKDSLTARLKEISARFTAT